MELIRQIVAIYKNYDFKTFVLVTSVGIPSTWSKLPWQAAISAPCPFRFSSI